MATQNGCESSSTLLWQTIFILSTDQCIFLILNVMYLHQGLRSERDSFTTRCYMILQKPSYGLRLYDRVLPCLQTNTKFLYIAFVYFVHICSICIHMPNATCTIYGNQLGVATQESQRPNRLRGSLEPRLFILQRLRRTLDLLRQAASATVAPVDEIYASGIQAKRVGSPSQGLLIVRGLEETESYYFANLKVYYMNYLI